MRRRHTQNKTPRGDKTTSRAAPLLSRINRHARTPCMAKRGRWPGPGYRESGWASMPGATRTVETPYPGRGIHSAALVEAKTSPLSELVYSASVALSCTASFCVSPTRAPAATRTGNAEKDRLIPGPIAAKRQGTRKRCSVFSPFGQMRPVGFRCMYGYRTGFRTETERDSRGPWSKSPSSSFTLSTSRGPATGVVLGRACTE